MDVDPDVIIVDNKTAITTTKNSLNQSNNSIKSYQKEELIIIDPESSESSSSDESDVELVDQYKLEDIRPVIGKYGNHLNILNTFIDKSNLITFFGVLTFFFPTLRLTYKHFKRNFLLFLNYLTSIFIISLIKIGFVQNNF